MNIDIGDYIIYNTGVVFNKKKNSIQHQSRNSDGYPMVTINKKQIRTHILIAKTFIPNPNNKSCVNHINGIKTDNRVENLEWCTPRENVIHAFKNGLMVRHKGEKNPYSKLNEDQVISIKNKIKLGATLTSIAKEFNVSVSCICLINRGKNWGHIII